MLQYEFERAVRSDEGRQCLAFRALMAAAVLSVGTSEFADFRAA